MGSTAQAEAPASESSFDYKAILHQMVQRGASDHHIKVGRPPTLRINGELTPLDLPVLRLEDVRHIAEQSMTARHRNEFAAVNECDFALGVPGIGRFRVNAYQQRRAIAY